MLAATERLFALARRLLLCTPLRCSRAAGVAAAAPHLGSGVGRRPVGLFPPLVP